MTQQWPASIAFFAFIGFDIVATMAERPKRPNRTIRGFSRRCRGVVTLLYVASIGVAVRHGSRRNCGPYRAAGR